MNFDEIQEGKMNRERSRIILLFFNAGKNGRDGRMIVENVQLL